MADKFFKELLDLDTWTGESETHAVYTVKLIELVQTGVFDWSREELNWSIAAYDEEQYDRVCSYFIERYRYEEIALLPVKEWMLSLKRRLIYELMPKYRPLYERLKDGLNPFQESDEYHKKRSITSDYPETILSANADYVSDGVDIEYETIREGNIAEMAVNYRDMYRDVDNMLLDELEIMFIQIYTANVNGL